MAARIDVPKLASPDAVASPAAVIAAAASAWIEVSDGRLVGETIGNPRLSY